MELIVLGCDGSWPRPGGAGSGYLLREDGYSVWLDAGFGTFARLQEHVSLTDLDAVVISHPHRDHFSDIYALFTARRFGRLGKPDLPVFAQPGFRDFSGRLVSERSEGLWRETFDWREVSGGETFEAGPFRFEAFEMYHFGQALGFRISTGGGVLAYSGDTGPHEVVSRLAAGAHTFLCEATLQDGEHPHDRHLTARQAGEYARDAGVGRFVLTHVEGGLDRQVSLSQAREAFDGEIVLAEPGLRLEVD